MASFYETNQETIYDGKAHILTVEMTCGLFVCFLYYNNKVHYYTFVGITLGEFGEVVNILN